jgi:hypothetical protein
MPLQAKTEVFAGVYSHGTPPDKVALVAVPPVIVMVRESVAGLGKPL